MKLIVLFFLISSVLIGQNIHGTILDAETKEPLENVNIFIEKYNAGTGSNAQGKFNFFLKSSVRKTDTLQFSLLGYVTIRTTILYLKENKNIVFLSKKFENLEEITVTTARKLNSKLKFKKVSSMPTGVYSFGSTLVDDKIYVIGGDVSDIVDTAKKTMDELSKREGMGFNDFIKRSKMNSLWENYSSALQIYNIEENKWSTSDILFRKRAYHEVAYNNNKLYVFGGKSLSNNRKFEYLEDKIEIFNTSTNEIIIDHTNPHQAINFASFVYHDNIIVMGGSIKLRVDGEKVCTDKCHIYNLASGKWYEMPRMTQPKEVNGVMIENKIYLIGGFNGAPLKEIESYDLLTGKWEKEGDLFHGIANPALTYHNEIIYIFSNGIIQTFNLVTKTIEAYHVDLKLKNAQLYCYKQHLYIFGGFEEEDFSKLRSSDSYSIDLKEFSNTEIINSKRMN